MVEKYISGHEIENISLHARLHSTEEIADDLFSKAAAILSQ